MLSNLHLNSQSLAFAQSTNSAVVSFLDGAKYVKAYSVQLFLTNSAPAAGTFTAAVTDIVTKAAHGYLTGLKVQLTNAGGALPAGLATSTDYFVIKIDANTFKLASSLVNANAGTPVDITGTGTGTHTITPTSLAGGTYKVQASSDGTNYIDLTSTTAITATANFLLEKVDPAYNYLKVVYVLTAGQLAVTQLVQTVGE